MARWKSNLVTVFPSGYRDSSIDPKAKLMIEENITKIGSITQDKWFAVVDEDLHCYINGYYFIFQKDNGELPTKYNYMYIRTAPQELISGVNSPVLVSIDTSEGASETELDYEDEFYGAGFNNEIPNASIYTILDFTNEKYQYKVTTKEIYIKDQATAEDNAKIVLAGTNNKLITSSDIKVSKLNNLEFSATNGITINSSNTSINTPANSSVTLCSGTYSINGDTITLDNSLNVATKDTKQTISGDKTFNGELNLSANTYLATQNPTDDIAGFVSYNSDNKLCKTTLDYASPITSQETSLEFIDTVTQTKGKVSATKKKITIASGDGQGQLKINGTNYNITSLAANSSPTFEYASINETLTTKKLKGIGTAGVYNASEYGKGYLVGTTTQAKVGDTNLPVYINTNGVITTCDKYAGGTKLKLNGNNYVSDTAIYAPTQGGEANLVLISQGTGQTPIWGKPLDAEPLYLHTFQCFYDASTNPSCRISFSLLTRSNTPIIHSNGTFANKLSELGSWLHYRGKFTSYSSGLPISSTDPDYYGLYADSMNDIYLLRKNQNSGNYPLRNWTNGYIYEAIHKII